MLTLFSALLVLVSLSAFADAYVSNFGSDNTTYYGAGVPGARRQFRLEEREPVTNGGTDR
jgi:hypothetical protein